jgi:predicted nucleic acid-binding protein
MPDLIVVSNTTPIITLLGIGKLEILQKLYGKIFIPQAVAKEVLVGKNKFAFVDLEQIGWVVIKKVENELLLKTFLQDLDEGEAEALALAIEMKADIC